VTPEAAAPDPPPRRRTLTGLAAVGLMAVTAAVAQAFGRLTYGILLPAIRDDFGLSNTVAGSLATVNVAAYLVGTLVVAWATARYRLLAVMRVGMLLAVAGLALSAAAPSVAVLAVGLFLLGLGGALTWIPTPAIAADAMAPEKRAFAIGVLGSGIGLGVVFTGQLAGIVRSTLGDESWRTVYAVQCLIGVVVVVGAMALVGHRQDRPTANAGTGGLAALRRTRGWAPMTCAYTTFGLMYLLVLGFLTTRLEDDSGWTTSQASLAFSLLGVAVIFGGPLFIALTGKIGPRLALTTAFATWGIVTLVIIPGWLGPTLVSSTVLGLLFSGMPIMFTLYFVSNTTPEDYGPAFAVATLAFGVAQMVSPQVGGSIADIAGSFTLVFLLSAGLAVVGLIAALSLPRDGQPVSSPAADWREINMTFAIAPVEAPEDAPVEA